MHTVVPKGTAELAGRPELTEGIIKVPLYTYEMYKEKFDQIEGLHRIEVGHTSRKRKRDDSEDYFL